MSFLIVPQITGYVGRSQAAVCENNRNTILREYQRKHAQDDSVTQKSVLDSHNTVCPDSKGAVTVNADSESLICSIHSSSTEQSGALQGLQAVIDSFAGKTLDADAVGAAADRLTVIVDQLKMVTAAAKTAKISSTGLPNQKLYWNVRIVIDTDGKQAIAMLADTYTSGAEGYLLYYNKHLQFYQPKGSIVRSWIKESHEIGSLLPNGKNTSVSWLDTCFLTCLTLRADTKT